MVFFVVKIVFHWKSSNFFLFAPFFGLPSTTTTTTTISSLSSMVFVFCFSNRAWTIITTTTTIMSQKTTYIRTTHLLTLCLTISWFPTCFFFLFGFVYSHWDVFYFNVSLNKRVFFSYKISFFFKCVYYYSYSFFFSSCLLAFMSDKYFCLSIDSMYPNKI